MINSKILYGGALRGKKTYLAAIAGIITAICGYLAGETDIFITLQTIFPLLGLLFLRSGFKDKKPKD
jgi:hypothetical protein